MIQSAAGKFIVFEGIDGSGKSTQLDLLSNRLKAAGFDPYLTFEPTAGPVGRLIRRMLAGEIAVDQRTIASLFAADRTDHLVNGKNGIRNIVDQGKIVLCDRYYFSSFAYHAQYVDMEWVIQANALNAQILKPDLTLFIDTDPDQCFKRVTLRGDTLEMYEKTDIMKRVRDNYFTAFSRLEDEETIVIVDGNKGIDDVSLAVWKQVEPLFENKGRVSAKKS